MTAVLCSGADAALRVRIVAEARRWIGTPYRHQASCAGAGTDCLGLIRGIWRGVHGAEPEQVPAYGAGWGEVGAPETLFEAARRNLVEIPPENLVAGDVLLFRMRRLTAARHVAVLTQGGHRGGRMIHAYSGHAVLEGDFSESWRRRLAAAFRFPSPSSERG